MPSKITIISALADNRVIGIDNKLPWYLPADLQHFKKSTLGKPIVMGRKTWESLPGILPGRPHIVITRDQNYQAEGATVVHSLKEAISVESDSDEVMIVGGANLYTQALNIADKLMLTEVHTDIAGDAFFPEFDPAVWRETERQHFKADDKNRFAYDFVNYEKASDPCGK